MLKITDLGTSFTSKLMKRLWQICGIKHKETTAYHPESNGLTEKFNGTLMRMIRAYLAENPNNWDQKLQSLLFAYRSVPQASTGFSPFELLFGRRVKGPLDLIKQNWEQITQDDPQDVVTYVDTLMNVLKRNLELAAETLLFFCSTMAQGLNSEKAAGMENVTLARWKFVVHKLEACGDIAVHVRKGRAAVLSAGCCLNKNQRGKKHNVSQQKQTLSFWMSHSFCCLILTCLVFLRQY